jgi:hypothetical protein
MRTTNRSLLTLGALLALAASADTAQAQPQCAQPGAVLEELDSQLRTGVPKGVCTWSTLIRFDFNQWSIGASQNLPVTAAAVALFNNPVQPGGDIRHWWRTFLEAQTGSRTTYPADYTVVALRNQPLPSNLTYFHGTEAFSFTYDAPVVTSVLAVRYWAQLNPGAPFAAQIAAGARKYLRANWAVYGLAASTGPADQGYKNGVLTYPSGLQMNARRQYFYNGPYLALAGSRSNTTHWGQDDRGPLLTRAMNLSFTTSIPSRESTGQAGVRTFVEAGWPAAPSESVYGLSSTDRSNLQSLVFNDVVPATLTTDMSGIRTASTFHLLAQAGFSGSCMESAGNGNGMATFAVGYFDNGQLNPSLPDEIQFLTTDQNNGAGSCTFSSAAKTITVRNSSNVLMGTINLLSGSITYHFRLNASGLVRLI